MKNKTWCWECQSEDQKHGPYHPDFEGSCGAKKGGFDTQEEAERDSKTHRCRFGAEITISKRKIVSRKVITISKKRGRFHSNDYWLEHKDDALQIAFKSNCIVNVEEKRFIDFVSCLVDY